MKRTELTKKTARYKGISALGAATATVLMSTILSGYFAILGVPITAWLTYRWFQYRAEWGLRF
jgi:hypothetical protein